MIDDPNGGAMKYLMNNRSQIIKRYEEDPNLDPLENLKKVLNDCGYRLANEGEECWNFKVIEAFIRVRPLTWDHPTSFE